MDPDPDTDDSEFSTSRRGLLKGAAGAIGVAGLGNVAQRVSGDSQGRGRQAFRVRVENVSEPGTLETSEGEKATPLSPGVYAVHTRGQALFRGLSEASSGLESLAEDGVPGELAAEVESHNAIVEAGVFAGEETVVDPNQPPNAPEPPIFPGGAFEFTVSAAPGESLSLATMFVQSNDLFFAPDVTGISLYENGQPVDGDVTDQLLLWDAGTEVDQEPGVGPDQAPRQDGRDTGQDENSAVSPVAFADVGGYDLPDVSEVIQVTVEPVDPEQLQVRVENVASTDTYPADASTGGGVWVTPGAVGVHEDENPIFTEGETASAGLELLAEAGPPGDLVGELRGSDNVETATAYTPEDTVADPNDPLGEVPGAPPIAPGGAFEFEIEARPGQRLSFASMFVPSNDVFFAPDGDGIPLFEDGSPAGDVSDAVALWDAGTEPNGQPGFGPDQAPAQDAPDQGAEEGAVVRRLDDVADGYTYPDASDAVRVTVTSPGRDLPTQEFQVRVENVAPADFYASDASTGGAIWITPGAFAVHPGMNPIFVPGREASAGLELLAEAGPPGEITAELQANPRVDTAGAYTPEDTVADPNDPLGEVPGAPPIAPGGAFEFEIEARPGQRLSFASMFVPSNDVFFAPDERGVGLFESGSPVAGDVSDAVALWDAGTEPNGQPGFGPDQAPAQDTPDQGAEESAVVRRLDDVDDGYTYPEADEALSLTLTPL